MSEYTPGPWRVYEGDPLIVCFGEGDSICDAAPGSPFVSWAAARANARLIAAAPDLARTLEEAHKALKALKDAVEASQKMNGREYVDLGIQVNKAIGRSRDVLTTAVGSLPTRENK